MLKGSFFMSFNYRSRVPNEIHERIKASQLARPTQNLPSVAIALKGSLNEVVSQCVRGAL